VESASVIIDEYSGGLLLELNPGYWRPNFSTDEIAYCVANPIACLEIQTINQ
jgi:hypothetical protein